MGAVGLSGVMLFLLGAYLLWQARGAVLYWLEEFFRILRGEFTRRDGRAIHAEAFGGGGPVAATKQPPPVASAREREVSPPGPAPAKPRSRGTLRLVGGLALIFLGQLLLVLDLAF